MDPLPGRQHFGRQINMSQPRSQEGGGGQSRRGPWGTRLIIALVKMSLWGYKVTGMHIGNAKVSYKIYCDHKTRRKIIQVVCSEDDFITQAPGINQPDESISLN